MLKKTITYTDLNGAETTEDYYFHINKGEMMRMQLSEGMALDVKIDRLIQTRDYKEIVATIESFIDLSYGVRSENGKSFIKNPKQLELFKSSEAYSELVWTLYTDEDEMREFIFGIFPSNLKEVTEETLKKLEEKKNTNSAE